MTNQISCFIIGTESHLIQCAEILLQRGHQVCGIISSEKLIKNWAKENGILHVEPGPDLASVLSRQSFDYLFSITNFSIIPNEILALPRKGAINFHDGPLPRYAGLHATSWALINQEKTHSVTWHIMSAEVDKGDILKQRSVDIVEGDTAFTLNAKCYEVSINSFAELVDELSSGRMKFRKQNLAEHTYFSKYKRPPAACTLSWSQPAAEIAALVRALDFGPYTNPLGLPKFVMENEVLIVPEIDVLDVRSQAASGTIIAIDSNSIKVATASNDVVLRRMLTINSQSLSISDFAARFGLNEGDRLPELEPETADHLTALNSEICRHEAFWVKKLANWKPIELPYATHGLALNRSVQYTTVPIPISDEVNTFLSEHDDIENQSAFIVAAFVAYLARISGSYTFYLGFSHPELRRRVVKFERFLATHVPFPVELDPSAKFSAALDALQSQLVLAKKHKTYASDTILRYPELSSLRNHGDQSLWSVVVELVECFDDYTPSAGSELILLLLEDGTECRWVYDTAVLDNDSIASMQLQFTTFLHNIVADNTCPIVEISLLTEAERHHLMIEWNNTQVDYPRHLCMHKLVEAQVERTPDAIAVVCENQQISYRQLNDCANQLAHYLRKLNVGPETRVGIYMERSLDMIVGLLGILKAGGAYLPLDHTYPAERNVFMVEDAQVHLILTQSWLDKDLPKHQAQVVHVDTDWSIISNESKKNIHSGVNPDNLSYVMYTSGSTGRPKGIMVCHGNVVNFFVGMDEAILHDPPGVWLAVTSISFDISVLELFWTLARGFKLILYADRTQDQDLIEPISHNLDRDDEFGEDAEDYSIPAQIKRYNVTHFQCTPSMASMLIMGDETRDALRSVQTFMVGGEVLTAALATQLKQIVSGDVINMYGPTEATIYSTTYHVNGEENEIPIGRPIANTKIYILDHYLQPVPVGVVGELFIGGDGVARGYLNRPDLTAELFIKHPFSDKSETLLYRTGDLARYRPDGNIEFLGRADLQVKIRGFRIELGEIETLLEQHSAVREVVVLAREDTPGDKRLVAYMIPNQNQKFSSNKLRVYLKHKLPEFMVPSHFVELEAFPLTPNQKIDHKALPAPNQTQIESDITYAPPKKELEKVIAKIWQELLNIPRVGIDDNFFDLGGNSLLIVQAHRRLHGLIDKELSITDMFMFPTIRAFIEYLSEDSADGGQTTVSKSVYRAKMRKVAMMRRRLRRNKLK